MNINSGVGRGFDCPVLDSQRCFRPTLSALAEPGTIARLESALVPPPGLEPATALVLLCLADYETPLWLPDASGEAAAYIRFHTGAPVTDDPKMAAFAVTNGTSRSPSLSGFHPGDDQYPNTSSTVIVQCASLTGGPQQALSGPGIPHTRVVAPLGLHEAFWSDLALNNARYPLGVDLILISGREIMGLPRSLRVGQAHEAA
jgi:alpha-D-ribose 1-methylphosphonate 5-triphosphate synthase subunit PhnH